MRYIYLAGPISGLPAGVAAGWRTDPLLRTRMLEMGWYPLSPFDGHLDWPAQEYDPAEVLEPWFEDTHGCGVDARHAVHKDLAYIDASSALWADLRFVGQVSIGTCMEIAYAYAKGIPTITIVHEDSVHHHPFVIEMSTHTVSCYDHAFEYLDLIGRKLVEPQYA